MRATAGAMLVTMLIVALPLTGCRSAPSDHVELPVTDRILGDGDLRGVLRFDGRSCAWVERTDGEDVDVVWPDGTVGRVGEDGGLILEQDGVVVASEGEQIRLGGGLGSGPRCRTERNRAWVAHSFI